MRIWITGIAGFLGGHLADALKDSGHYIVGNDNFLCSSTERGLPIDCRFYDDMHSYLYAQRIDVLIHCAATAHEGLSNFSPSFITRNIYEASVATFSAAIAAGVKRIVFLSSMARYGDGLLLSEDEHEDHEGCLSIFEGLRPFTENMTPKPVDPYGIAKVAAEQTLIALCRLHNVEYVIAAPHNIIGPRQKYDDPFRNVCSIMINRALQGKTIPVYGDGSQKRCFSPIADCLDSLVKMIDAPISGEIINIGPDSGEISVLELAKMIQELTACGAEIEHFPARPNEVKEAWCSSDKARRLLGYAPKQSLRDCLAEMVLYIKNHGTKPFTYNFPIEIEKGCPSVWLHQKI